MVNVALMLLVGQCVACGPVPVGGPAGFAGPAYPFPADTVLGVRDDPLDAYADLASELYPHGIPTDERGAALGLLREARTQRAVGPIGAGPIGPAGFGPVVAPPGFDVQPLGRAGTTEGVAVTLPIEAAASGSVTLIVVGRDRELVPVANQAIASVEGSPQELTRSTQPLTLAGGRRFTVMLPPASLAVADAADVFVRVRIAGRGVAEGYAGTVPLRTIAPTDAARLATDGTLQRRDAVLTQPRQRVGSVVLSSERGTRSLVRP